MTKPPQFSGCTIRRTRLPDCPLLPEIERSAAALFASDPALARLALQDPIDPARHAELIDSGLCFVAVAGDGSPCGFIATQVLGSDLHIWELSVETNHQQRGLGRQLLVTAERAATSNGLRRLTLTTFRDLAWNGPFYKSCGFAEWPDVRSEPRLAALLDAEAQHGLDADRRCAMVKTL
jgi:ribosomal protein S18 acetylase RimI-like enzyme